VAPAARPDSGRGLSFAEDVTEVCAGPADPPNRLVWALRWWSKSQRGAEVAGGGNCLGTRLPAVARSYGTAERREAAARVCAAEWEGAGAPRGQFKDRAGILGRRAPDGNSPGISA
jgi:hypothetical protein